VSDGKEGQRREEEPEKIQGLGERAKAREVHHLVESLELRQTQCGLHRRHAKVIAQLVEALEAPVLPFVPGNQRRTRLRRQRPETVDTRLYNGCFDS
ncbi:MAG: hypothetical protein COB15_11840, partial [Flavobacteriales bacterium]